MRIYDNTFHQAISCPLKLYHIAARPGSSSEKVGYRHRNKLQLRDVIALRFGKRRFTSDSLSDAEKETKEWLREENTAVCGAVLRTGNFSTRIPLLVKEKDHYTIVQVHGKLRKRTGHDEIQWPVKSRSTASYLLKAAYRAFVLAKNCDVATLNITLCFPNRVFRSTHGNLLQILSGIRHVSDSDLLVKETEELFAEVDATRAVEEVMKSIPASVSHPVFTGLSVEKACEFIAETPLETGNVLDIGIHRECKYCDFRRESDAEASGCWNRFFPDKSVERPGLHVFELIGHGNDTDSASGFYYQEQVPNPEPFSSFESLKKQSGDKFTIYLRRMLQLLKSKGAELPSLWVRSGIRNKMDLNFPLHFLDFEAATYALPLERGEHPYQPVYFQFSCHTLRENGTLEHYDWLDQNRGRIEIHEALIDALSSVPQIREGTIIQYSQFEYRAMKNILKRLKKNAMRYRESIDRLEQILTGSGDAGQARFLDLSRVIEENYYNRFMHGGIGLKHVLKSVLTWQKSENYVQQSKVRIHDLTVDLYECRESLTQPDPDPYLSLSLDGERIGDGSEAMNAWLSLKNGLLSNEEKETVPVLLRRYCALDSYALVILFRHLHHCMERMNDGEDLIIF